MERITHAGTEVEVPDLVVAEGPTAVTAFLEADATARATQLATLQQAVEARRLALRERLLADPAADPVSLSVTLTAEG